MLIGICLLPCHVTSQCINNMLLLPIIIYTLLVGSWASQKCEEYIANLINNRFLTLDNTTILYSGLAINNPGQME